ncbi:hypothetical protein SUGI_0396190 [Cryptomeria japonica]|nr:hypothetical protein SUGI_0396190 [Cryptomeria japonica]
MWTLLSLIVLYVGIASLCCGEFYYSSTPGWLWVRPWSLFLWVPMGDPADLFSPSVSLFDGRGMLSLFDAHAQKWNPLFVLVCSRWTVVDVVVSQFLWDCVCFSMGLLMLALLVDVVVTNVLALLGLVLATFDVAWWFLSLFLFVEWAFLLSSALKFFLSDLFFDKFSTWVDGDGLVTSKSGYLQLGFLLILIRSLEGVRLSSALYGLCIPWVLV